MAKKKQTGREILAELRKEFNTEYDVIGSFSDINKAQRAYSTGNLGLDFLTGVGGFPVGKIVELHGPFSSGKSTSAFMAMAQEQKRIISENDEDSLIVFLDYERSLDPLYCHNLGLDVQHDSFVYVKPDSLEQGVNLFRKLLASGDVRVVCFDSVAAMVSEKEKSAETGAVTVADRAKALHQVMRQIKDDLDRFGTTAIFLNHTLEKVATDQISQRLAARGVKQMTQPGGQALPFYACLASGTKVLSADTYKWIPVEEVSVGSTLVAFDEYKKDGEKLRKMRRATVTQNDATLQESFEIQTDRGTATVSSYNHKWLVSGGSPTKHAWVWKTTEEIEVGDEIAWFATPWEDTSQDFDSGYLSGIFDGEGSVNTNMWTRSGNNRGFNISMCQLPGVVLDETKRCLDKYGFKYNEYVDLSDKRSNFANPNPEGYAPVHRIQLKGQLSDRMRFLGQISPKRLVENLMSNGVGWDGAAMMSRNRFSEGRLVATVTSKKSVGETLTYAVGTTTSTLLADGMFSHNSLRIEYKKVGQIKTKEHDALSDSDDESVSGQRIQATVIKNKVAPAFTTTELRVRRGKGFSQAWSVLSVLTAHNEISVNSTGWYEIPEDLLPDILKEKAKEGVYRIRGEEKVLKALDSSPVWLNIMEKRAREILEKFGLPRVDGSIYNSNGEIDEEALEDSDNTSEFTKNLK